MVHEKKRLFVIPLLLNLHGSSGASIFLSSLLLEQRSRKEARKLQIQAPLCFLCMLCYIHGFLWEAYLLLQPSGCMIPGDLQIGLAVGMRIMHWRLLGIGALGSTGFFFSCFALGLSQSILSKFCVIFFELPSFTLWHLFWRGTCSTVSSSRPFLVISPLGANESEPGHTPVQVSTAMVPPWQWSSRRKAMTRWRRFLGV